MENSARRFFFVVATVPVALSALIWTMVELRLRPSEWWMSRIDISPRNERRAICAGSDTATLWDYVIQAIGNRLPSTCLSRSLALVRCLSWFGIAATIRVGACLEDGGAPQMHAWVEYAGGELMGGQGDHARFVHRDCPGA